MAPSSAHRSTDPSDLTSLQLFCRVKGHAWRHDNDVGYGGSPRRSGQAPAEVIRLTTAAIERGLVRAIERHYSCRSCNLAAVELVAVPSFELVSRRYNYADSPGYLLSPPTSPTDARPSRSDFRREQFMRSVHLSPPPRSTRAVRARSTSRKKASA